MKVESHRMQKTLQIAAIENELRLDGQQPCGRLEWLADSYRNGDQFWRLLKGAADALLPGKLSSVLFAQYNLYYDFIARNMHLQNPAFSWYEPFSGMKSVSFRELGQYASGRASFWRDRGLTSEQTLCIVRPTGFELLVELMAALKIGCRTVLLPPLGRGFIQRRLAVLDLKYIAADARNLSALNPWLEKVFPEESKGHYGKNDSHDGWIYKSGSPVFSVYDPSRPERLVPTDISSDALFLGAMRDGLISLGLGSGQVCCAPGLHFMETCPSILMAGLLCGSTHLHLTPKDIEANPELVSKNHVKVFGVSKKIRDLLIRNQIDAAGIWQSWFRDPAESTDMDRWYYFSTKLNLQNSYAFNLKWNPALGGCTLFSARRKGTPHPGVLPAAGSRWQISDSTGSPSPSDFGMLALSAPGILKDGDPVTTGDRIVRNGNEWLHGGISSVYREGMVVPVNEILETLQAAYPGLYMSMFALGMADPSRPWLVVLVVFHGVQILSSRGKAETQIRSMIKAEMGEGCLPDKIEFFPLYPRFLPDMTIDHQWCREEYESGRLTRRIEDPAFRGITRIRAYLLQGRRYGTITGAP